MARKPATATLKSNILIYDKKKFSELSMEKHVVKLYNEIKELKTPFDKKGYINTLSNSDKVLIARHPYFDLLSHQIIQPGEWRYHLFLAGRGAGKTYAAAAWCVSKLLLAQKPIIIGTVNPTAKDIREVQIPAILAWSDKAKLNYAYNKSYQTIEYGNGSILHAYSSELEIRGPNFDYVWCDELCKWCNSLPNKIQEHYDLMDFACRIGDNPQILITTTPKPFEIIKHLYNNAADNDNKLYSFSHAITDQNTFLPTTFRQSIKERFENTHLGRQELLGEIIWEDEDSLFHAEHIDNNRITSYKYNAIKHDVENIVIGVDPAVSATDKSDETGIVVAAKIRDEYYILGDYSLKGSPAQWSNKVMQVANHHGATMIIAEKNQGGDMVYATLLRARHELKQKIKIELVHASVGKRVRAEPISLLYEQNKVHHVGFFRDLEDQMLKFSTKSKSSPDRLDALVYAIQELSHPKSITRRDISGLW